MRNILDENRGKIYFSFPQMQYHIVTIPANNQLSQSLHARALEARGILYAPDYLINAGGLINVAHEGPHYDAHTVLAQVEKIYDTLLEIFERAKMMRLTTQDASDQIARERFIKK